MDSCVCPAVTVTASTRPFPSVTKWNFDPHPPRERPSAWSAGSKSRPRPLFARPGGSARSTHIGAVDEPEIPIDLALLVESNPQCFEDAIEEAFAPPAVEAIIDALPFPVAFGHVSPWSSGAKNPEHPIERDAVVVPSSATFLYGEKCLDQVPVIIREFVARHLSSMWRTS